MKVGPSSNETSKDLINTKMQFKKMKKKYEFGDTNNMIGQAKKYDDGSNICDRESRVLNHDTDESDE